MEGKNRRGLRAAFVSLRVQIMVLLVLCYLIPVLILSVFIQGALIPAVQKKTESALTAEVEHAWVQTVGRIDEAIALSRDAIYDGELAAVYENRRTGGLTDAEFLRQSRSYIDRKYSRNGLFAFAAYFPLDDPGQFMYTRSGYDGAVLFRATGMEKARAMGDALDTRAGFLETDGGLYLVRNLVNLRMERYGMLVLGLEKKTLLSPLLELGSAWQGQVRISLNDTGDTGTDWDSLPPGMTEKDGEIRFVRQAGGDYTLRMLLTLSRRQQYREVYQFRQLALGLEALLIPVLALLAWYVQRRIVRPITLLYNASRRIGEGEWGVTVPMHGGDELGELGSAFSSMSLRIQHLIDRTYKEELEAKNAQIQALQSRINPHFINNALEAINWQARIEGSAAVPSMVNALSVLLGASMARQDRHVVSLREEMKVAEAYIFFIRQRFGEDLTVRQDVEEAALDCPVPLLTVQPVLENAVEHGIAPAGGGEIGIACRRFDACVRLEISNTGRGIGPEDRRKIDAALRGETASGAHLGLANIASRLKLIYGGRAAIGVFSDGENRTVVRIDVPRDVREEDTPCA